MYPFLTFTTVKGALINQIEEALKGTAAATLAAYDQNTGDYLQTSNGDIWKGSYNISKSESLVDRIKRTRIWMSHFLWKRTDYDFGCGLGWKPHFRFTGGRCDYYKGSAKRRRIFQRKRIIEGNINYGYYMPVYQNGSDSEIIGMVFVGTDKAQKMRSSTGFLAVLLWR